MKKWAIGSLSSVQALFPGERRGIYILHFENGEQYVGQTVDVVSRFAEHRHGSAHHEPWEDLTAIEFLSVPEGGLDLLEREWIGRRRTEAALRNKAFNFGHAEPSPLDEVMPARLQGHWATGQAHYDPEQFLTALRLSRSNGDPKLLSTRRGLEELPDGRLVWEAVVDELAQVVAQVIPNAVETEGRFWSLSDYPGTAGGRFATLNVAGLELAFFPRARFVAEVGSLEASNGLTVALNAREGTFIPADPIAEGGGSVEGPGFVGEVDGMPVEFWRVPSRYATAVDRIVMPLGVFGVQCLDRGEVAGTRWLAIHAMRSGTLGANQRRHSPALTRYVYKRIVERGA